MTKFTDRLPIGARRLLTFWKTADGGPGSGNWGHKGRPGLVGGSGKGGGKQYRGGRGDIMYTGSRKDWMNGLKGEQQKKATALIKEAREDFESRGLTGKPVEQLIMENKDKDNGDYYRFLMLDLMAESRNWNEYTGKLIDENLDENDKKIVEAISEKYGKTFTGGVGIPDETEIDRWNEEDVHCWQDLKSKAMGGYTSGADYPDKLQYAAGLKERPKPKMDFWWNRKENFGKTEFLDMITRGRGLLNDYNSEFWNVKTQEELDAVEKKMFENAFNSMWADGFGGPGSWSLSEYLDAKASQIDKSQTMREAFPGYESLSSKDQDMLRQFKATALLDNVSLGTAIVRNTKNNKERCFTALEAYAKALGTTLPDNFVENLEKKRVEAIEREKREKIERYNQRRESNKVVIQGDAFSEKIDSMRKQSGQYTEAEIKEIGNEFYEEVLKAKEQNAKRKDDLTAEIEKAAKKVSERFAEQTDAFSKYLDIARMPPTQYLPVYGDSKSYMAALKVVKEEYNRIRDDYLNAQKEEDGLRKELRDLMGPDMVKDALKRIRKTGGISKKEMNAHLPGRSTVRKFVAQAFDMYPTEWFTASSERGTITTKKVGRGYCDAIDNGTIGISGYSDESMLETAVHELGHRFERSVPGIVEAERAFYERRTQGESLQKLRDITGNKGYENYEVTRPDQFTDPYMGKYYKGDSFELVSMGFEQAFTDPESLMKDRDYAQFIFGLLAVG